MDSVQFVWPAAGGLNSNTAPTLPLPPTAVPNKLPLPRIRMVDGFNEGWIDFEGSGEHRRGSQTLEAVIAGLIGTRAAA